MKFLVDNPVSPLVTEMLRRAGHDANHVCDYSLQSAEDSIIFDRAFQEDRIIITADTDFGLLLARSQATKPSVILFHHSFPHRPSRQGSLLLHNLTQLALALEQGNLIVFESRRIRIRTLPIIV